MAGTDGRLRGMSDVEDGAPAVVLVGAQLGENVGAAARAMLNCGLGDLRLVAPRDGWPNPQARAAASGADAVLDAARLYDDLRSAVADLHHVYATTARPRDVAKPVLTPQEAAAAIRRASARGERTGLLFGRERIGLTNDELSLADAILTIPLNPGFSSLNLAQAVLLLAWEWRRAGSLPSPPRPSAAGAPPATRAQLLGFFDHLEGALEQTGFFKTRELRPSMVRNLRAIFHRANLSEREVRTLHGVVTALCGRRKDQLE
ncbi:MAG: RNA methyltransferase [Acidobacteria bacterium]|nr:MAG: RNA methyltransferase [Acidobacteriota bacterium]